MAGGTSARGQSRANDEPAASESQEQAQVVYGFFKKPQKDDREIEEFRERVERDRKELEGAVKKRVREAEKRDARRREDVLQLVANGLRSDTPDQTHESFSDKGCPVYTGTFVQTNPSNTFAARIVQKSNALVADYDRLEQMFTDVRTEQVEPQIAEKMQREVREKERLLAFGRNKALRDVMRVLGLDERDVEGMEGMEGVDGVHEGDAMELDGPGEVQRTLQYVERGVKRIVKGLPMDGDEMEGETLVEV